MEPNYSRHALIRAFCRSITRGVTLAFQSPSVCFEICDNQSRLPFVTACSVWCGGKKAWPIAMEEFPCFLFNSSKLSSSVPLPHCTQMITTVCMSGGACWIVWCFSGGYSRYVLHVWVKVCVWVSAIHEYMLASDKSVCVCMCVSCTSVESEGDQTVSQLPWEGSSGCDREEEAKYPGSNTLCLSHNEAASPGSDNTHRMVKYRAQVRRWTETLPWPEQRAPKRSFHHRPCLCICFYLHYSETSS